MANNGSYKLSITATDRTTAAFKSVNDRIKGMQAPFKALERQLQQFGKLTGLSKVGDGIKKIGNMAFNAVASVVKLGLGILGIAGVSSLAGIVALTRRFAEMGNELKIVGLYLGLSSQKLQGMRNLSSLVGASAKSLEGFTKSFREMQRVAGLNDPDAAQMFIRLGLNPKDNVEENMEKIMDRVRTLFQKGRPEDAEFLMNMAGIPPDLMKLVMMSREERAAKKKEAAEAAKQTQSFSDAWDHIYDVGQRFYLSLDTHFKQLLTGPIKAVSDWLEDTGKHERRIGGAENEHHSNTVMLTNQEYVLAKIDYWFNRILTFATEFNEKTLPGIQEKLNRWLKVFEKMLPFIEGVVGEAEEHPLGAIGLYLFGRLGIAGIISGIGGIASVYLAWSKIKSGISNWSWKRKLGVPLEELDEFGNAATRAAPKVGTFSEAVSTLVGALGRLGVVGAAISLGVWGEDLIARIFGQQDVLKKHRQDMESGPGGPAEFPGHNAGDPPRTEWQVEKDWLKRKSRQWFFGNPDAGTSSGSAGGVQDNNPGNLRFANQNGAVNDNGFAKFPNMDAGISALDRQLSLYYNRDHLSTLNSIINKYAPKSENNVESYLQDAEGTSGFDRNQQLNLNDAEIMRKVKSAIVMHEVGHKAAKSIVDVNINHNAPAGTTITASGDGPAIVNPPKVVRAMNGMQAGAH